MIGAAAVAVLLVVTAAVVYFVRGGYRSIDFDSSVSEVDRLAVSEDGSVSYFSTAFFGDRAVLAYERPDKRLEVISVDPATGEVRWRTRTGDTADRWKGISVFSDQVVAVQETRYDSNMRTMVVLNADKGDVAWSRSIGKDDDTLFYSKVVVVQDVVGKRLVGLDRRSGREKWSVPNPKDQVGAAKSSIRRATSTAYWNDPTSGDGNDQRVVLIGADRSARVIDVDSGTVRKSRTNVAAPDDQMFAFDGRLLVASKTSGYQVLSYDLSTMGEPVNVYTAPDQNRTLGQLGVCGNKRVCVLDSAGFDRKSTRVVAIDPVKGGEVWKRDVPEADSVTVVGRDTVVRGITTRYVSWVFDAKGKKLVEQEGAVRRIDGGNMLIFSILTDSIGDVSLAGLNANSESRNELGQLKGVRSSTCSWNTRLIACGGNNEFVLARFAQ